MLPNDPQYSFSAIKKIYTDFYEAFGDSFSTQLSSTRKMARKQACTGSTPSKNVSYKIKFKRIDPIGSLRVVDNVELAFDDYTRATKRGGSDPSRIKFGPKTNRLDSMAPLTVDGGSKSVHLRLSDLRSSENKILIRKTDLTRKETLNCEPDLFDYFL